MNAWDRNELARSLVVKLKEFDADLIRVGVGLEFWLRGELWRRELAEATRKVLVEAGYLPLRRVDDVLMGDALRATVKEMFPCKESE
ncbi:hypothetical protein CCB80_02240 [Armatimonadetes bacterium Uphvl-Ar1]|nr:hypothetical protein CCB80_02240 [Armatimonadetes bacterium Uphvl-Ar1]